MIAKNDVMYLIMETDGTEDAAGFTVEEPQICKKEIFCSVRSVKRMEYYEAMRNGIKAVLVFTILFDDYHDEEKLEYLGKIYKVERTYRKDEFDLELTVSEVE